MCFTQPISLIFTIAGVLASQYLRRAKHLKNDPRVWRMYIGMEYFTAMEFLQFIQYFWVDQCDSQINKILTWIGLFHIAYQPVFSNLMTSYDILKEHRFGYDKLVIPMCVIAGTFQISRIFGYDIFPCDDIQDPLCGKITCTFTGTVHLRWILKMRAHSYITPGGFIHSVLMFVPMMIAGAAKASFSLMLTGPILGYILSRNKDEWASIWCFYSVGQAIFGIWLSIRNYQPEKHYKEKQD
ncbi:hypothetical protein M0811_00848 [Anaeramoeba ignava]|uniref:Uncharacterized protein n=1 Tax=Anaeramoeba ignava TaxID=1746090 RepID=A0A9Q0RD02_ANAIG|nr:hypothetical protein M0811_00848 [Anaeramoeba ignava]|eukprot:Anaeramoba_ignava/a483897_87.p1 GENE.a483897_87~~a483897_87.p1  ORF type:complete len:240 (-),score=26.63 a483897_87:38-757(-)